MIVGAPCEEAGGGNDGGAICLSEEQGDELVREAVWQQARTVNA